MTRIGSVVMIRPAARVRHDLRLATLALLSLAATIALPAPAAAQNSSISGVVKDPQLAVVPGAEVVLRNSRSAATPTAVTDSAGRYAFTGLQPGTYLVQVYLSGFEVQSSSEIVLAAEQSATQDFVLALAGQSQSITVTGTASPGYRVDTASIGSLAATSILETPYMVNVLPASLMANNQARSFKEASRYLPLIGFQEQQGSEVLRPQTRGMQGANMQNSRMDGMGIVITGANSMEMLQQIEVLNGLGGALYGPANPSGMFNFVPKRPTEHPVRQVSVSYDGHSVGQLYTDVGGRTGSNQMFGYRVNALAGQGEAFRSDSELERRLFSFAGDVRPFSRTTIEGLFSYYRVEQRGFPGWFTFGRSNASAAFVMLPAEPPDPTTPGFGQPDSGLNLTTRITQGRVKHDFSTTWHLIAGVQFQQADRDISTQVMALQNNAGDYVASLASGFAPRFTVLGNLTSLNGRFTTGFLEHMVAFGVTGYQFKTYSDFVNPPAASVRLGSASIASPVVFPLPPAGIPTHTNIFNSGVINQQGFNMVDSIALSRRWSTRIAISQDWIWTDNYTNAGVRTGGYKDNGLSPLASLMFRPSSRTTVYGTYGSSLQQGDIAPATASNASEALPPYRSTQTEIGYKIAFPLIDLATAVFRINRPFAMTDPADNVFKVSGDQVNTGFEAIVTGRVTERLLMFGGLTVVDPTLTKTGNPLTDGKQFVNIPTFRSNLLTEYRVWGDGTYASVNWQYVGARPIDDINSTYTPAYNVVDLGVRHSRAVGKTVATWKFQVNNVADVHYWSTIGPGNITGTNVGSYTGHFGTPRTVQASIDFGF
jgi:iron complex outermembrane receptor protein